MYKGNSIFRFACPWSYYFNLGQNSGFRIFSTLKIEHVLVCEIYLNKNVKKQNRAYTIADKTAIPSRTVP